MVNLWEFKDLWDFYEEHGERLGDRDFVMCYQYNHDNFPFKITDVASVFMIKQGEKDGESWQWEVSMKDDSRYFVEAGCDYTGWD